MTIPTLIIAGAGVGLVASLYPNGRWGCAVLSVIPVAMAIYVSIEMADPARRPDALDALAYVFVPLWPSLGALAGFLVGRGLRGWIASRKAGGR